MYIMEKNASKLWEGKIPRTANTTLLKELKMSHTLGENIWKAHI
jgi:hypothetical protein